MILDHLSSPVRTLIAQIESTARDKQLRIYLVGGIVRDLLLGMDAQTLDDIDIALEGDAILLAHTVRAQYGGDIIVHERFRTATWFPADHAKHNLNVDLITARYEVYGEPAALPTITPSTMEDDLLRRDFTINTLTLFPDTGEIVDLYGGRNDLTARVIRVLHDYSFVDDPTRHFRAVRYEQRLQFTIERYTEALMTQSLPYIKQLSGDRIRHELEHIFRETDWSEMLARLDDLGVLAQIVRGLTGYFPYHTPTSTDPDLLMLCWVTCQKGMVQVQLSERLNLSPAFWKQLSAVAHIQNGLERLPDEARPSQIVTVLERHNHPQAHQAVRLLATSALEMMWLEQYEETWQHVKPLLDGNDLIAMGLQPGRYFSTLLRAVHEAQLDGDINDLKGAVQLVKQLIDKMRPNVP